MTWPPSQVVARLRLTGAEHVSLLDYNMVTGATSTLLNSNGIVLSYPGD